MHMPQGPDGAWKTGQRVPFDGLWYSDRNRNPPRPWRYVSAVHRPQGRRCIPLSGRSCSSLILDIPRGVGPRLRLGAFVANKWFPAIDPRWK